MKLPKRFFLDGGMVLMYALSVLVILATIGISIQSTGSSLMDLAKESQYRRLAQHAADSGIRYGTAYVRELLDPLEQWDTDTNKVIKGPPTFPSPTYPRTIDHSTLPGASGWDFQISGNYPPVHPCNIYWRLNDNPLPAWVKGTGEYRNSVTTVPLDPPVDGAWPAISASNPPMYATSFQLSLRAVNIRTSGMVDLPGVLEGKVTSVGIRWQDLVDEAGAQFCHACTSVAPASQDISPHDYLLDTRPATGPNANPITASCFCGWEQADPMTFRDACSGGTEPNCVGGTRMDRVPPNAAPPHNTKSRGGHIVTSYCTFSNTQPYLLTCTGTCYIYDPLNPGNLKKSAVATVVVTQVITVTTRNKKGPGLSTHSTYIVTTANQEW